MSGRSVKQWLTADELKGHVLSSLVSAFTTHPRTGWVRADQVADIELLREVNDLRKQVEAYRRAERRQVSAPEGSEEFAGGGDKYTARGWVEYRDVYSDKQRADWSVDLTWDQLFLYVGPKFETPIQGDAAMSYMGVLYSLSGSKIDGTKVSSRGLYSNVAHQIMYQFQALGFIVKELKWVVEIDCIRRDKIIKLACYQATTQT